MKLLILGGTVFLGRHLVAAATARGHELTLFNRGTRALELPGIRQLHGEREGDLGMLAGERWDAVIDTSGYLPQDVRRSAQMLAATVSHYTLISSISAYAGFSEPGMEETAALAVLPEGAGEKRDSEAYGALKARCEQEVESAMPGKALIIRPGLIVGPFDPTDRFTYWPERLARGGEVLAPGRRERPVQFIDARDLADWIIRMVEARQTGTFNATGPERELGMETLLQQANTALGSAAVLTWVDDAFLQEQEAGAWMELPLWIPEDDEMDGFLRVSNAKAVAAGLHFRPVADTVAATQAWNQTREATDRQAGLRPEREQALLAAWHGRKQR
jgi:2'-hydroxyisoflavone reductase